MRACPACPNRWMARIARSIGDEDLAREIEEAGCNNWKALQYATRDPVTRQPGEVRIVEVCMRDHLPQWFNSVNALAEEACQTAQTHRNVVAEGFSFLSGRPITGDCASLPVEFRERLAEAGIGGIKALPVGLDEQ